MRIHLCWVDKNWKSRGYANNYHLIVDMEQKKYRTYTNTYSNCNHPDDIEVKRKSDIVDYIKYLKANGFKEVIIIKVEEINNG